MGLTALGCQSEPTTLSQPTIASSPASVAAAPTAKASNYTSLEEVIRRDIETLIARGDFRLSILESVVKPRLKHDPELALTAIRATASVSREAFDDEANSPEALSRCVLKAVWIMQVYDMALDSTQGTLLADPGNRLWVEVHAARLDQLRKAERLLDRCLEEACYGYIWGHRSVHVARYQLTEQKLASGKYPSDDVLEFDARVRRVAREVRTTQQLWEAPGHFPVSMQQWTGKGAVLSLLLGPAGIAGSAPEVVSWVDADVGSGRAQTTYYTELSKSLLEWADADRKQLHLALVRSIKDWYGTAEAKLRFEDAAATIDSYRDGFRR